MAIKKIRSKNLNAVRIISRQDEAIDFDASEWDLYEEDPVLNENSLKFKEGKEPTIFLCNFALTGKEQASLQDAMVSGVDEEKNPKVSIGKYSYQIAKVCLKDIQNPANELDVIRLKKDSRGYVSDETMTELHQAGVVNEIFNHYFRLTQPQTEGKKEIKN